jgi:cytoskeleton protein RodZ
MTSQKELIPMRPGDILRYEREQKGLTIELASRQSRIKRSVLVAIESGETGEIPSVYLRGYIRNYARFLGVDPADLEDKMEHVKGAEPEVRTVFTVKNKRGNAEKWLKASSYLAASALIATLAWQFSHEAVRFSQGDSQLASSKVMSSAAGEPGSQEGRPDVRPANTHLNASIASVETLGKPGTLTGNSAAEQAWAAISGTPETEPADVFQVHNLSITTSADTWVEISDATGDQLELDLIRAGSSRQYLGQPPFNIMIGRASAVVLDLDGSVVDLGPYTRGNVARMTLQTQ